MEQPVIQQNLGGGIGVIGQPKPEVTAGDYVPGAAGMPKMRQNAPVGAASFGMFMNNPGGGSKVLAPMEKPIMKNHVAKCREWFSSYLNTVRPEGPLKETETVPKLLVLIMAMFYANDQREKWDLIECMRGTTIPMATSHVVCVPWEHQKFTSVPYATTEFPLGVAITILEHCANTVFDDLKPLLDRSRGTNGKVILTRLAEDDRPRVGPSPFRDPTPDEREAMKRDYGVTIDTPLFASSDGGATLLMDFGGTRLKASDQVNYANNGPEQAGSVPTPTSVGAAQPTQPGNPVFAQPPGGQAPM